MIEYVLNGTLDSSTIGPKADFLVQDWVVTVLPTDLNPLVILVHNGTTYLPSSDWHIYERIIPTWIKALAVNV
jgi:hypothetical protein